MTAKTGKDQADEVEAVPAEERAEAGEAAQSTAAESAAAPARPAAKRKRRVRVIEVIDDEDLDEVLEALDAEDAEKAEAVEAAEAEEEAPARPAKAKADADAEAVSVEKAAPKAKPKPRPARLEPPAEDASAEAPAARPGLFGLPLVPTVVFVVLVALLASVAIWKWTSAGSMSSEQDERDAIGKVASSYGDVAYNYNPTNYQTQTDKAVKLLAGDMLDDYKKNTVPTVASAFQADPQVALTSKTNQVFVGSVNGKFATAVLMMDMALKTKDGTINQPATLLRLSLSKIDGKWKITQQYPSGINDQNRNQQQSQIPGVPNGGATQSPKPGKTEKPKN
ncbi:hypothetical protein HUT06_35075 [Actinomadura sp. NAK00032]|uniref:hypothetical protein n=1 Tax=Actinomadura sp. NAK00032 TaxID=2742128 RepID=UPI00159052BE|nr:hypothetical protein [Actinomadura sp. NAK00032]QKW38597.1 hypothetical protein HUT06_35075 [Actinomadura sp. NAK00032]